MLSKEEIKFIQEHAQDDPYQLSLSKGLHPGLSLSKLAPQIQARQKLVHKLPTWISHSSVFFPPQLNLEQASSEDTALFKAGLIHGKIIDITGGMGVDSWAFAQQGHSVTYVERDESLVHITRFNHQVLVGNSIHHVHGDGIDYMKKHPSDWDYIYIDPARRGSKGEKVILLEDCEPNVIELLPFIENNTQLLIKTSPLLDISRAIQSLKGVDKVWIICVKNEVKELLFLKSQNATMDPVLEVHELSLANSLIFQAKLSEERETISKLGTLDKYLYEPHPGILKAGFFKLVAGKQLHKLGNNTHVYTSAEREDTFPGRQFKVIAQGNPDKKWIETHLPTGKANISTRNFPMSPEEIRKKWKIKEGGPWTLFAYQDEHQKNVLALTEKCPVN
ncbi:class I SAM-dependent methyltransferase [Cytophagaceae bacterium 50C-KIRBA]|uniref:Class I SAM-dependent methyltransferase n=1 Tax=Aquirufa beregesia TaxID=2516556 RepID=A0ABX0EVY2_9BACT|nr:class I SAM-dependent methyltransferase [Aquirufa beregesia]NGZ42914.1 class I SAM-dependent methyltransferase [Aquirufa beregesia]